MSFPHHDQYWVDTANFLQAQIADTEQLLAPAPFWEKFPKVYPYSSTFTEKKINCQWAIIHKGMLDEIESGFTKSLIKEMIPVFANEVFVVFSTRKNTPTISPQSPHIISFWTIIKSRHSWKKVIFDWFDRLRGKSSQLPASSQNQEGTVFSQKITNFDSLSVAEIKQLMDQRYDQKKGYEFPYLWDKVRYQEVDRHTLRMLPDTRKKKILEIGGGTGRSLELITEFQEFIFTDLSDSAILQAKELYGDRPNIKFLAMDAMDLKFPNEEFDIVLGIEMIEHVNDAVATIKEAFRVLKPNGIFIFNSANSDSLHLRMNRKLGYPPFKVTWEHIKEFTVGELVEILNQVGFAVKDTSGVFLKPYWGIPNIDQHIRHLTDNDPETIEIFRELGERAGAEYAFTFFVSCIKPSS